MFEFRRIGITLALAAGILLSNAVFADHDDQSAAIEAAVLDYVIAFYEMRPELIDQRVSPRLQKMGYMPAQDSAGLTEGWMTFGQLRALAATLNQNGLFDPESSPRVVTVLDHSDMIATVKLEAAWGIDYLHLSRHSGDWMIINVIWETPFE
ncbi:MAG: nuclear transport factor 2 family protein [Pseudomonadota bacterium]